MSGLMGTRWVELFSGIGGFARAIRALGGEVVVAADKDEFVASIHKLRFDVPILEDVGEVTPAILDYLGIRKVDGVCGGFPCQPVSLAGKGLAQDDERWLWPEFLRVIVEFQPSIVLIENVPGLRKRGMAVVLADLAAAGYDAEWDGLPAAAFGAPHLRDRLWITAYPAGSRPEPKAAVLSMFGLPIGSSVVMRAGALRGGKILECEPRVPLQASRAGGWSYWSGKLLPTPEASDGSGGRVSTEAGGVRPSGAKRAVTLATAVSHDLVPTLRPGVMLPTPKAQRYGSSQNGVNSTRPSAGTPSLDTIAARELWPTPKASASGGDFARTDREGSGGDDLQTRANRVDGGGMLNPDWVDWLMGFPVGWTNPDVPNDELQPHTYAVEPGPRIAPKVPNRTPRLTALGNALVSYCAMEALTWSLPLRRHGDRDSDDVDVDHDGRQDEAIASRE